MAQPRMLREIMTAPGSGFQLGGAYDVDLIEDPFFRIVESRDEWRAGF